MDTQKLLERSQREKRGDNTMTREELHAIIKENRFSNLICMSGDEIVDLIREIYHDGMVEGYDLAIFRLQMLYRMPIESSKDYVNKQGDKIKRIMDAIYEQRNGSSVT